MTRDEIIETMTRALWLQSASFRSKAEFWDTPGKMLDADKQPYFALAHAAIGALDTAGFVVVPKEPTDAMLKAGYNAMFVDEWNGTQAPMMGAGYDAMIDARPK